MHPKNVGQRAAAVAEAQAGAAAAIVGVAPEPEVLTPAKVAVGLTYALDAHVQAEREQHGVVQHAKAPQSERLPVAHERVANRNAHDVCTKKTCPAQRHARCAMHA